MKNECQWLTILTNKDRKVTLKLFLILTHNCQNIVPWPPEIALLNTKCPQPQMFYLTQIYILILYKIMLYEGKNKMPLG